MLHLFGALHSRSVSFRVSKLYREFLVISGSLYAQVLTLH